MAASQYRIQQEKQQDELISRLVQRIVGVEVDDENHDIAVEFCRENIKHHRFLDPQPRLVDSCYEQLEQRLQLDSQTFKSRYLSALRRQLPALPWLQGDSESPPELPYAVLSLLFSLSRRPLGSNVQGRPEDVPSLVRHLVSSSFAQQQQQQQQQSRASDGSAARAAVASGGSSQAPKARADASDEDDDDEEEEQQRWSSGSELSEWSDGDVSGPGEQDAGAEEWQPSVAAATPPHDPAPASATAGDGATGLVHPLQLVLPGLRAVGGAPPSKQLPAIYPAPSPVPRDASCGASDLVVKLLRAQGVALPPNWRGPPPGVPCLSDAYITQQLLLGLQGRPCALFQLQPPCSPIATSADPTASVAPGICTPYLSSSSLAHMLQEPAAAAASAAWLLQLVDAGQRGQLGGLPATTPCLSALVSAVAAQLQHCLQPVCALEQIHVSVCAAAKEHGAEPPCLPLLSLLEACRGPMAYVQVLQQTVQGLLQQLEEAAASAASSSGSGGSSGCSPVELSALLIDRLASLLAQQALCGGSAQGQRLQRMLLHLLMSCLAPLVANLERWLCDSHERTFAPDFFVAGAVEAVPVQSPSFWQHAFTLVTDVSGQRPACPDFLGPSAGRIFAAGRSLRLLRNSDLIRRAQERSTGGTLVPSSATSTSQRVPLSDVLADQPPGSLMACFVAGVRQTLHSGRSSSSRLQPPAGAAGRLSATVRTHGVESASDGSGSGRRIFDLMAAAGAAAGGTRCMPVGEPPAAAAAGSSTGYPAWALTKDSALLLPLTGLSLADTADAAAVGSVGADIANRTDVAVAGRSLGADADSDGEEAQHQQQSRKGRRSTWDVAAGAVSAAQRRRLSAEGGSGDEPSTLLNYYAETLEAMQAHKAALARQQESDASDGRSVSAPAAALIPAIRQQRQQLEWLLDLGAFDLPPVGTLLHECMLQPVLQRVEEVGQRVMGCVVSEWGLLRELRALRNAFLLTSGPMAAWAEDELLAALSQRGGVEDLKEYELEVALGDVCSSVEAQPAGISGGAVEAQQQEADAEEVLPPPGSLTLFVDRDAARKALAAAEQEKLRSVAAGGDSSVGADTLAAAAKMFVRSVHEVEAGVSLQYQPSWLLAMVCGGSGALAAYNHAFQFMLQVRWAKTQLDRARQRDWKAAMQRPRRRGPLTAASARPQAVPPPPPQQQRETGGSGRRLFATPEARRQLLALQEMMHFVATLQRFLIERLLSSAWEQLAEAFDAARSLDEVCAAHGRYLSAVLRHCGRGADGGNAKTWRHITAAIRACLDEVLYYCNVHASLHKLQQRQQSQDHQGFAAPSAAGGAGAREEAMLSALLTDASRAFRDRHAFLLTLLGAKTLKVGGDESLEELVAQLDCNGFYSAGGGGASYNYD